MAESTTETAELCQAYVPVARAAKTRQVASYSLGMKILHFSNGYVLDDNGQRVAVPLSAYDDGRDISTVNGNIDLFVETETKRKTASCRELRPNERLPAAVLGSHQGFRHHVEHL